MNSRGNVLQSMLVLAWISTTIAAQTISFEAFDPTVEQGLGLSFAAFEMPAGSAIDLAAFDLPIEPMPGAVDNGQPAEAPRPRLRVTIYSPTDFYCPPCQRMERDCGQGDADLLVKIEKRPLAAMPQAVKRAGQSVGYPVIEFGDGTLICGARSFAELKRLAREYSPRDLDPRR